MGLNKYKVGELVSVVDERNDLGIREFYGININKEFMPTAANTEGLDENKYKVVRKERFVYSGMQTGRDECIRVAMYNDDKPVLVSPAYVTFEIIKRDIVNPMYLFMIFMSKEKDRYGAFCSDGSIRSNLDWDVFCDIEIELPDISIQQKYVDVYNSMLANQKVYESRLDDLKIVLEGYMDKLKNNYSPQRIGNLIELSDDKNDELMYGIESVRGVSNEKMLIDTKADMQGVNLEPYYILRPNEFAYVSVTSRNGEKISLAINDSSDTFICSSSYIVFRCKNENELLPQYLMMFFSRQEFNRYSRFNSWGSARETFDWSEMCDVRIPVPDISVQESIVTLYESIIKRRLIADKLNAIIKKTCPILIKGSLEEAQKEA